jgi:type IV pilus assembly protein PilX
MKKPGATMIPQSKRLSIRPQSGMVLVTSLLLLIVVTLLAVGMFRSFGLDEKIAGNVREKQRALGAAETAEQYAESWLAAGNGSLGINCVAPLVAANLGQVCSNLLATPTQVPYTVGVSYIPTVTTPMNVTGVNGGQGAYYLAPTFYIAYLGATANGSIYQIDAAGYGGSVDTAAVVEATYLVTSGVKDLGAN